MLLENNKSNKIYIKYYLDKTIRANIINNDIDVLYRESETLDIKKDKLIYIIKDEPNDSIKKHICHLWNDEGVYVSIFNIKRLLFNILEHVIVPKHEILNEEKGELTEFIEKYNITNLEKQLPEISRFDPVAMVLFMKPGEVCKITRNSKTAMETFYYRYCINN